MTPALSREIPNTATSILAAAKAIAPALRARSAQIESDRRLPSDVVELLRGTGVFRMGFGTEFGGPALTAAEQTRVLEALAYGDTSAAWCAMVGMDSGLFSTYMAPDAVRELFPTMDESIAGMLAPGGRAERVADGYRLSGQWSFASGISHADWVFAGAHVTHGGDVVRTPGGNPEWRVMLLPPRQVQLIDRWHTTGLNGTGSLDYTIDDVFVPEQYSFSFREPRVSTGPLSTPDLQMRKMPGVALGVARAALDHAREVARTKVDRSTGVPWSQDYQGAVHVGGVRDGVRGDAPRRSTALSNTDGTDSTKGSARTICRPTSVSRRCSRGCTPSVRRARSSVVSMT
ncbi:acyl-CoA dehydrogenase family protein [Nocardia yamanashiensis]|uniref:acyl-CoA dehydrogenase family protein n=1 Tax=Nocardia yamanashiensis TaxID=209247 RepID=UPI000AD27C16|nr:acyl-CoA dehydrogenase family protein [Nocardia yamanashiensis]